MNEDIPSLRPPASTSRTTRSARQPKTVTAEDIPPAIRSYITLQNGSFSLNKLKDVIKAGIDVPVRVVEEFRNLAPTKHIPSNIPILHHPTSKEEIEEIIKASKRGHRRTVSSSHTIDTTDTTGTNQEEESTHHHNQESQDPPINTQEMSEDHDFENVETEEERIAREQLEKAEEERHAKELEEKRGRYQEGLKEREDNLAVLKASFNSARDAYKKQDATVKESRAKGTFNKEAEDLLTNLFEKAKKLQAELKLANNDVACFKKTSPDGGTTSKRTLADLYSTTGKSDKRNPDGTLIPSKEYNENEDRLNIELPGGVDYEQLTKAYDILCNVNGNGFYDAEANALGFMDSDMYFLIPTDYDEYPCALELVGAGYKSWKCDIDHIAQVYALAKEQVSKTSWSEEKKIKWAMLRTEAFKNGWFAYQPHSKYADPPADHYNIFSKDLSEHESWFAIANKLSGFVPFVIEFHYRAYNRSYDKTNAQEYMMKVRSLARAVKGEEMLDYSDDDMVYGDCFRWIGVERPVHVMEAIKTTARLAEAFKLRLESAPAGRALIGTSWAVIQSLTSSGWWDKLENVNHVNTQAIEDAYKMIIKRSWRYHMYYTVYTRELHTDEEKAILYEAEKNARLAAPILQAYIDIIAKGTDLGKARVLKKPACSNMQLYISAKKIFVKSKRFKVTCIADLKNNPAMQDEPEPSRRRRRTRGYIEDPNEEDEDYDEEEETEEPTSG